MGDNNECNGTADDKRLQMREAKTNAHIEEIVQEKHKLDNEEFPVANRLLDEELKRTKETGKATFDFRYTDLYNEKPMKVVVRVLFPTKEYPNMNFVGKLLGPGGATLRTLQENTRCRMLILGRGSMRDKNKEEELRNSGDPKYAHLSDQLHVEVSCVAPPSEAHNRMAFALRELRGLLLPDPPLDEYGGYMEEGGPIHEPRRPIPAPSSTAKVMSILEKARHAMDFSPPPPPRRFGQQPARPYQGSQIYDGERGGGQWGSDYKVNPTSRFFPARTAPYSRP